MSTERQGPYGTAVQLEIPAGQRGAQTADWWLITAPQFHPLWSQYVLMCVKLDDDVPGFPPPYRRFDGATHEVLLVALDPEHGPYGPHNLGQPGSLHFLRPVNICEQFTATDDEMRQLVPLLAAAVVNGVLNPETSNGATRIRSQWLTSMVKTLAHMRGEEHAP